MATKLEAFVAEDLLAQVRRVCEQHGISHAALIRASLKLYVQLEVERALTAARAGSGIRSCPVCSMPRRADGVEDAMAHAQCDQIVANLDRQVETR